MRYLILALLLSIQIFADDRMLYTNLLQFEKRTTNPGNAPTNYVSMFFDGAFKYIDSAGVVTSFGGSGGVGDVVGPSSAVDNRLASFNLTTGKLIKDSGILSTDVLTKTSNTTLNKVAIGSGNKALNETSYTIPTGNGSASQVLTTDGVGAATWQTPASAITVVDSLTSTSATNALSANQGKVLNDTKVTGPASSGTGNLPSYSDTTGKLVQDSGVNSAYVVQRALAFSAADRVVVSGGANRLLSETAYAIPLSDGSLNQVLKTNGTGSVSWSNTGDIVGPATATVNRLVQFSDATGKLVKETPYTVPTSICANGEILKSNGTTGFTCQPDNGGAGGTGDVVGPASVTSADIVATYSSTSGKAIKDSGILATNIPTMAANGVAGNLLQTAAANKAVSDSGISVANVVTNSANFSAANRVAIASGTTRAITQTAYTIPATDGTANQILKTNGSGVVSWATDSGGGTGDVVGPASSVTTNLASFNGTTGKLIADSGLLTANIPTMATVGGVGMLLQTAAADRAVSSAGIAVANIPTMSANATAANNVILSGGINKTQQATAWTIPLTVCTNGQILQSNGTNYVCVTPSAGTGDVVGPASAVTTNLASFNGATGKLIADSGLLTANIPTMAANGVAGNLLQTAAASKALSDSGVAIANLATMAANGVAGNLLQTAAANKAVSDSGIKIVDVATKSANFTAANRAVLAGGVNRTLSETAYTIPATDGTANYVLKTNGAGVVSWAADSGGGTGDVVGPASSVTTNLASFNGTTGKLIADSGLLTANIPTMAANGVAGNLLQTAAANKAVSDSGIKIVDVATKSANFTAANRVVLAGGVNRTLSETAYTIPATDGTANYVLKTNGAGVVSWATDSGGTGDVVGPASSVTTNLASFNGTTGKLIQDSGLLTANIPTMASVGGVGMLLQTAAADRAVSSAGIAVANIPTMAANATAANNVILSGSTNKTQVATAWTIPLTVCTNGQVLQSNGTNYVCVTPSVGTGDVVGPASSVTTNLAAFNGTTGKLIADSGLLTATIPTMAANGVAGNLLQTAAASKAVSDSGLAIVNIPTMAANGVAGNLIQTAAANKAQSDSGIAVANVVTNSANFTAANRVAIASGTTRAITQTAYTIPAAISVKDYVLQSDGTNLFLGPVSNTYVTLAGNAIDWSIGNVFYRTVAVDTTFTYSNQTDGDVILLGVNNSAASAINITLPNTSVVSIPAATTQVFTVSRINGVNFYPAIATGNVTGPAVAADNSIPRYDGTTGKLIQGSGVIIDDTNNVTGMGTLNTRTIANWVDGPASSLDNEIPTFSGTSGKILQNISGSTAGSGIVSVGATAGGSGEIRLNNANPVGSKEFVSLSVPYNMPLTYYLTLPALSPMAGDGLISDSSGNLSWLTVNTMIAANNTIYVATTGNDTTGTGAVGAPYATVTKALSSLDDNTIAPGITVTISVAAGTYTFTSTLLISHPQGDQISIVGAANTVPILTDFSRTGNTAAARNTDSINQLAMLKTKFPTQFNFNANNIDGISVKGKGIQLSNILVYGNYTPTGNPTTSGSGITSGSKTNNFDGGKIVLSNISVHGFPTYGVMIFSTYLISSGTLTSSGNNYGIGATSAGTISGTSYIGVSNSNYGGVASLNAGVNFSSTLDVTHNGSYGFYLYQSSGLTTTGVAQYLNNGSYGLYVQGSSHVTHSSTVTASNNGNSGLYAVHTSSIAIVGVVTANSNTNHGMYAIQNSAIQAVGAFNATSNTAYGTEALYASSIAIGGTVTCTTNTTGCIYAGYGSVIKAATCGGQTCSPAISTVGNVNAIIAP